MSTNFLNLDEFEGDEEKSFTYKGQTHVMQPLSVGDFIKQTKQLAKIKETGDETAAASFMLDSIMAVFPTLPKKDAETLNMARIDKIWELVNGTLEEAKAEGN